MAANSKREKIILNIIDDLERVSDIKTVIRVQPSGPEDLQRYAATQLPLIAVVGMLPAPVEHVKGRDGFVDVVISVLAVNIYCYLMDNVDPDAKISSLLDDIWVKLYADQTRGGNAYGLLISPEVETGIWEPYAAFSLVCNVTYKHTIGGI